MQLCEIRKYNIDQYLTQEPLYQYFLKKPDTLPFHLLHYIYSVF